MHYHFYSKVLLGDHEVTEVCKSRVPVIAVVFTTVDQSRIKLRHGSQSHIFWYKLTPGPWHPG